MSKKRICIPVEDYPQISEKHITKQVKEAYKVTAPARKQPSEVPLDYTLKEIGKQIKKVK